MKRGPSGRAASPTNTTYSGISNYRTESYKPTQPQPQDTRQIARVHYLELSKYLASYLANEPANSRSAARQKLTRLTRQQFQELSTDVYDELVRRKNNADSNDIPFLPVRDDFHPKRNQARQKLATLPTSRFKDLSSDVYYELVRRYPEFKEEENPEPAMESPDSTYDDFPSPDFPATSRSLQVSSNTTAATTLSTHKSNGSAQLANASLSSPPLPPTPYTATSASTDYPSPTPPPARSSQDLYSSPNESSMSSRRRPSEDGYPSASRRRPSEDMRRQNDDPYSSRRRPSEDFRRSEDAGIGLGVGRRPSMTSSNGTGTSGTNANMATSGMVIPAKSTIAEEDIEVPFARRSRRSDFDADEDGDREEQGGLNGLPRRLGGQSAGSGSEGEDEYFDKMSMGRISVGSGRDGRTSTDRERGASRTSASAAAAADFEKARREYEFKIATMQSKIVSMEREAEDRIGLVENLKQRADEEAAERDRDSEEIQRLRDQCRALEDELEASLSSKNNEDREASAAAVEQLRQDTEELLAELSDVSARNDELIAAREADARIIRDLEGQVREWRRKYETAKTELRSVKVTSQLYSPQPAFADNLPMSSSGAIPDTHITAFLASIDALLAAGRTNAPTRVLSPMKAVINAVTAIVDDLRAFAHASALSSSSVRPEELEAMRERAEATLGNLVTAAKSHATSAGMAPVSLLDAAASHVAAAVTDIGRTVLIRRATKAEQDSYAQTSNSATNFNGTSGFSPSLRAVEEIRNGHQRGPSQSSISSRGYASPTGRPPSGRSARAPSSVGSISPPPIFDHRPGVTSDDSAIADGSEDAWAELKPYLEAQTESIVYAIQSVLSGVRSPTPSPTLAENLTQIITIVSSIVAVCTDALPPGSTQGKEILRELSDHANKLSEMQALPEVTKESRQVMAKSSFAIANAMKGLQKL
ncbi:hypothetical protein OF83DRAFT_1136191 [Amylostereum chailletii]|nr:hypothetical protein OF83DRAFT_1136191 [Amylostereum chailletii]